jgi:hypothetical protein
MKTMKSKIAQGAARLLKTTKEELMRFKQEVNEEKTGVNEKYKDLLTEIRKATEELKDLLALNAYVTRENAQAIALRLNSLEDQIANAKRATTNELKEHLLIIKSEITGIIMDLGREKGYDQLLHRIEDKFHRTQIKLEILMLKAELGKMEMQDWLQEAKASANRRISAIRNFPLQAEEGARKTWLLFRREVEEVYAELRHTFTH